MRERLQAVLVPDDAQLQATNRLQSISPSAQKKPPVGPLWFLSQGKVKGQKCTKRSCYLSAIEYPPHLPTTYMQP
jgi:hypothetical protein